MSVFTETDAAALRAPHVCRAFFLELALPDGDQRYHSGMGQIDLGGKIWSGAADPLGGRLVSLGTITQPDFGKAVEQTIVLSGADSAFVRSVRDVAAQIEGARADLYFSLFDPERETPLTGLKMLFSGRMTAPKRSRAGNVRQIAITIESRWSVLNFSGAVRWNGADQRRRNPGDKGLDEIGLDIKEQYQ